MRTIQDVIEVVPSPVMPELSSPRYVPHALEPRKNGSAVALAVSSMKNHSTDEGWQLALGLEAGGYSLCGFGPEMLKAGRAHCVNVRKILGHFPDADTVFVQDPREWEGKTAGRGFDTRERFEDVESLAARPDLFKVTVLKDAHRDPEYHAGWIERMGAHAIVTYYHPRIVRHLAPFVREEHLVRTYHTVDADRVPPFDGPHPRIDAALLSGAVSGVYPLRTRLVKDYLRGCTRNLHYLPHPGYGRDRCHTPDYLRELSKYKVAVCTSSALGYSLRKLVEATACGCRVITDLPADDVLPEIDGNLVRVRPDASTDFVGELAGDMCRGWDRERQAVLAWKARTWYDYRAAGKRLAADIEALRKTYRGEG